MAVPQAILTALALVALSACGGGGQSTASGDWLTYNKDLNGDRFSNLSAISTKNVAQLQKVCHVQLESGGTFQSGPLIVDGTMYLTTFHGTYALNPETCATKWHDTYTPRGPEAFNTNRGVAYMNGMLFRGFQDGHLKALDAATGKTLWDVPVGDAKKSEFLSSAPLAWDGMVITGIAGADWGSRGRVMAFDAKTGKQLWRFDLIPQGSEPGADTWGKAETASTGGGSTWTTYTLDPTSGALYVPVGNPAPDFSNQYRPGDNLYTDSIVVLDAHTGKLRWYHQFVANDSHDYDIGAAPALITTSAGKHLVLVGAKNAMLYALDPSTHQIVWQTPVSERQNVTKPPTLAGIHVCPGWIGGVEWNGPAYDPQTNDVYVNSVHACATYKVGEVRYTQGSFFLGGAIVMDPLKSWYGWTTALDADTGKIAWRYKAPTPMIAAVTPTAGGLVFTGDMNGTVLAFDARSGAQLFSAHVPGAMAGGVVTYTQGGKQYVMVESGNTSRTLWSTTGSPNVTIFALRT
ncbi:MAG TPA: PQQ-binding-like beta-propeller repeat protein [Candidatus Baltobacteraceae bacterium]|nr:PQQ-binding-like beta-propeller repeat protein [Candidatus Baltobacteraceae bacterium]